MKRRKRSRRIFSIIMAVALCFSMVDLSGVAEAVAEKVAPPTSGTCGENLTWKFTEDGTLTISGTGEMRDYIKIDNTNSRPWHYYRKKIKTVKLLKGLKSIGDWAFYDCDSLEEVNLPEGLTSIRSHVFSGCDSLKEVSLPKGLTSIGSYAFAYCDSLEKVSFPKGLTSIGNLAFSDCNSLKEVSLPEGLTGIGSYAFWSCGSLRKVSLPEGLTRIGDFAFWCCGSLEEVNFPESLTRIAHSAFNYCKSLRKVSLPEKLKNIESEAFAYCDSLKEVKIFSRDCIFHDTGYRYYVFPSSTVIYGYAGSTAQTYAEKYGNSFVELGQEVVKNFSLDSAAEGNIEETVVISGTLELTDDVKIGETSALISSEVGKIEWTSSDPEIAEVTGCEGRYSADNRSADLSVEAALHKAGTVTITGKASNGLTASCEVTVKGQGVIKTFKLNAAAEGEPGKEIIIPGTLELVDDVQTDGSSALISSEIGKIEWTSSNPEIVEVTGCEGVYSMDNRSAELLVETAAYGTGTVTIKGKTSNGLTAGCEVTVKEKDNSIQSVTKSDVVQDDSYGITSYKATKEGKIYDLTIEFDKALNDYLEAVKDSIKNDLKNADSGIENAAKKLRQADEGTNDKMITIEFGAPESVINSAYEALAMYLDTYTQAGIDLGKIDLDKSTVEISIDIVNKIRNSMGGSSLSWKIGEYFVEIDTVEALGAFSGTIKIRNKNGKTYIGNVNTTAKETAGLMTQYINELSDTTKDVLKGSLQSVLTELNKVTGIGEVTEKELKDIFEDEVEALQKSGYGNVLKNAIKLKDGYDLVKKISAARNADDLESAFSSISSIYKKLNDMDYSDEAVSKASVKAAMDKLTRIKENLSNMIYDYIYDSGYEEEEGIWESFKKIFIQCPVDFTVYDSEGNVLGYVDNGEVSYDDQKILIEVSGDVKTLYAPETADISLKLTATGSGEMNYVIEEVKDGKITGRINYYDIPLEEGIGYSQELPVSISQDSVETLPIEAADGKIYADEYIPSSQNACVTISSYADDGGVVVGDGDYPKGSPVELSAFPADDTYEFFGWFIDGNLTSLDSVYRFTALEDASVRAGFRKKLVKFTDYAVTLGDSYEEFAWVDVYANETNSEDVVMRLQGADKEEDYAKVLVKKYFSDGNDANASTIDTRSEGNFNFWLENMDVTNYEKVEIYDNLNRLIVTLSQENSGSGSEGKPGSGTSTGGSIGTSTGGSIDTETEEGSGTGTSTGGSIDTETEGGSGTGTGGGSGSGTGGSGSGGSIGGSLTPADPDSVVNPSPDSGMNTVPDSGSNSGSGSTAPDLGESSGSGDIPAEEARTELSNAAVTLSKTSFVYNGKARKPSVSVKVGSKLLTAGTDYTVSYTGNIRVGKASVSISGKGSYTGTVTKTFTILPKGISLSGKLKAKKKAMVVKWKRKDNDITGYQVQYSTSGNFAKKKTKTAVVKKEEKKKLTIKKLKAGKRYYVRIRVYKKVNGKTYASSWSKKKSVKIKK